MIVLKSIIAAILILFIIYMAARLVWTRNKKDAWDE